MKKIKVVQIGIGHDHATLILHAMLHMQDRYEVAGLIVAPEEWDHFQKSIRDAQELVPILPLEKLDEIAPDAVVVEAEDEYLTKYALLAARKGYPVHMDKPGSQGLSDFEELIHTLQEKNLPFHTGYMYRYNPKIRQVMERIRSGELGKIYSIEAHMDCLHSTEKRRWLGKYEGGMMRFLGCHLIDIIYRVLGEPSEVIPYNTGSGLDGVDSEDIGFVVFRYPDGVSFAKTAATEPGGFLRRQLVFCGEKETVELRPIEEYEDGGLIHTGYREVTLEDEKKEGWNTKGSSGQTEGFDRYEPMMEDFAAVVCKEKESEYSKEYELGLYRLLEKCCRRQTVSE